MFLLFFFKARTILDDFKKKGHTGDERGQLQLTF